MEQKRMQKNSKGITLIALVITIIVLLILAGVVIATLTGDNGVLTQAGNAKDKTTEAESIERVQVEVAGSYGVDGTIDKEQLNKNLKNIAGLKYNGADFSDSNKITELPATVTLNGFDIVIDNNGDVKKLPAIIAKIMANPTAYYGKKVTNYKDDGKTYRIFYVDKQGDFGEKNTIYLKADYSGSWSCSTSYDASQTKVREMNPDWAKARGDSESSWNSNEKTAAWLCDTSKWTDYCDSDKANYAIGGPSVEMYVKSYNQAFKNKEGEYVLGANYRATSSHGYIYTLNGSQSTISDSDYSTGHNSLNYTEYNSMYCGQNKSNTGLWWLASPSAYNSELVCAVSGYYEDLNNSGYGGDYGVSPLVSLKSSFIPEVEE